MKLLSMRFTLVSLLLIIILTSCGREFATRTVGDLRVTASFEPNPPRVGENTLKVRVTEKGGKSITPSEVRFHSYPFVFRVKDAPADPDEVVRVMDALAGPDGYTAKVSFEKPGPWKITVKIVRPEKPDTFAIFTLDVRG